MRKECDYYCKKLKKKSKHNIETSFNGGKRAKYVLVFDERPRNIRKNFIKTKKAARRLTHDVMSIYVIALITAKNRFSPCFSIRLTQ